MVRHPRTQTGNVFQSPRSRTCNVQGLGVRLKKSRNLASVAIVVECGKDLVGQALVYTK